MRTGVAREGNSRDKLTREVQYTVFNSNTPSSFFLHDFTQYTAVVPFFTQGSALQDMLVFAGSTVLFPCMAVGFPPPQFTWVKAGAFQVDTEQGQYFIM